MLRKELIFLLVILALSFAVRIWPMQSVHWWDETVYLQHAEIIAGLKADNYSEFGLRPPLLPLVFAAGFLAWHNVYLASIIVALFGVLGVAFICLIGRRLYGGKAGLIAGLFLGLSPLIAQNSRTLMTDVPSLSLILAGFYFLLLYSESGGRNYGLLSGFFFALGLLMRFSSALPVAIAPLAVFALGNKKNAGALDVFGDLKVPALAFFLTLLPYLAWSQLAFGFFLWPFINAMHAISTADAPLNFYFLGLADFLPIVVWLGFAAALAFAAKDYPGASQKKMDLFLLLWFVAGLFFLSVTPHKEIRYLIATLSIPAILLSARGHSRLFENSAFFAGRAGLYFAFLVFAALCIFSFGPAFSRIGEPFISPIDTEEHAVSQFINSLGLPESEALYTNFNYPVFAYYTKQKVVRLRPDTEQFYHSFPSNMPFKGLLLIYKGNPLKPGQKWVESRPEFRKLKEFENITLYEYSPPKFIP